MSLSISVVINTYNRAKSLALTLAGMRYLRHPAFEVVVVPGPCTDETSAVLEAFRSEVRVVPCPEQNLSVSRNIGIANAAGDIIAFIDDDAIPEPNWLDGLEAVYLAAPRAGGVGGYVRDHTGVEYQAQYIVCDRFGNASHSSTCPPEFRSVAGSERYPSLIGVNSSFRREALLEIGGFDEEYAYFLDETDVCVRLIDRGWSILLSEAAEVHHKFAASHLRTTKRVPTSLLATCRSKIYYQFRHHVPQVSDPFDRAITVRKQLLSDVALMRKDGHLSEEQYHSLLRDVELGFREGISDAHGFPDGKLRRSLQSLQRPVLKRLSVLREPGARVKLILVSELYLPKPLGGVGVFIVNLAQALARAGHEVSVITRSDEAHTVDFEDGVWVHRVPLRYPTPGRFPRLPDLPDAVAAWAYTVLDEALRIQALRGHSHVLGSIWDLETIACAASGSFKTLLYLVTTYALSLPTKVDWQTNRHFRINHVDKVIAGERWLIERSSKVLASTSGILRDVQCSYAGLALRDEDVALLPFGLPDRRGRAREKPDGQIDLLYVGRFEPRKGIDVLLGVLPGLLVKHPTTHVRLVGNDTLEVDGRTLKSRFLDKFGGFDVLNRIHFLGEVGDEQLIDEYASCDVFVAPSRYESFGLIYLEAMREGKPVVGCDTGGVPDIVTPDVGLLAKPGDALSLDQAIDGLLSNPSLRTRLGAAGRQRFVERFHIERFAASVEQVIETFRSERAARL